MAVKTLPSREFPHVEWIDLRDDGTLHECAIMKRDANGNIYFFEIHSLDDIDKRRLFKVITNRNAHMYELWDLMSQVTLGNGVNALEYFHQLVRVITPRGRIISPTLGVVGASEPGIARSRPRQEPIIEVDEPILPKTTRKSTNPV
jgi:hypothetical protein